MRHDVFWGVGSGLDGRKAGRDAAEKVVGKMGTGRPALVLAFISCEFAVEDVMTGLNSLLGGIEIWGFTTIAPITPDGEQVHSVLVVVICGKEYKARVEFLPNRENFSEIGQVIRVLETGGNINALLLAGDGINPPPENIYESLGRFNYPVAGCLASGGSDEDGTCQVGENRAGRGAISILALGGRSKISSGRGTGWRQTGMVFKVSKADQGSVKSLDEVSAIEVYSRVFGYPLKDWLTHPWIELIRLYPLGIERFPGSKDLLLRSPLRVEMDGSLRMNARITEGQTAHLLIGDPQACLDAAKSAALQALHGMGNTNPMVALLFIDIAWRYLFNDRFDAVISQLREVLGETPILGAYTFGQVYQETPDQLPQVLNQHLQVVLIGRSNE